MIIANTRPVVINVSRREGHVTFDASERTPCMKVNGLFFAMACQFCLGECRTRGRLPGLLSSQKNQRRGTRRPRAEWMWL
jgi:hypothetical protein